MKLNVEYSIEKDLFCYDYILVDATAPTYGVEDDVGQCLMMLPSEVGSIVRSGSSRDKKLEKLRGYLSNQYIEKKGDFEDIINEFRKAWGGSGDQIIYCLEAFYNKSFPFKEVTAYLTTNVVCPYNFDERWFFIRRNLIEGQLSTANHELNHFMFHHYYADLEKEMGDEKGGVLKESLTFFTDFNNPGFPDEEELRKLYLSKKWKNVDEIIEAGKDLLLNVEN